MPLTRRASARGMQLPWVFIWQGCAIVGVCTWPGYALDLGRWVPSHNMHRVIGQLPWSRMWTDNYARTQRCHLSTTEVSRWCCPVKFIWTAAVAQRVFYQKARSDCWSAWTAEWSIACPNPPADPGHLYSTRSRALCLGRIGDSAAGTVGRGTLIILFFPRRSPFSPSPQKPHLPINTTYSSYPLLITRLTNAGCLLLIQSKSQSFCFNLTTNESKNFPKT